MNLGACRICGGGAANGPYCRQCKNEGLHREYALAAPPGSVVAEILRRRGYGDTAIRIALDARAKVRQRYEQEIETKVPITALADRLRQAWGVGLVVLLLSLNALAGRVNGTIQRPNGQPLVNGSISFTLSQAGTVPSSLITVTTDPVYCATDDSGNVVGIARPVVSPVLSSNYGAGFLPAGTYYVQLTYWNASGETVAGPESSFVMTSPGTLIVSAPVLQPANAQGYNVYLATTSGGEHLQAQVVGWNPYSQSSSTIANTFLPPATNTTTCSSIFFNDVIVPSYTTYSVNLVDMNGKQVSGYPQRFYLQGSTVDLSTLTPASNVYAKFPNAIVSQPAGNGLQSIAGPLSLGSYILTAGGINAPWSHPTVNNGIAHGGTGFQHVRVTGCTTPASTNGFCVGLVNWPTQFADTNYTAICWNTSGTAAFTGHGGSKTTTGINYSLTNEPGSSSSTTGAIDCIAVHD